MPAALLLALTLAAGPGLSTPPPSTPETTRERASEVLLREARHFAMRQLARTHRRLPPGRFPTVAPAGRWHTSDTSGWLAGFYPGRLWLAYQVSGRQVWARRAADRQAPLLVRQDDSSTHDLGFLLQTSFGAGARLTHADSDTEVTLRAAAALADRWVPRAGAIRSWEGPTGKVTVIVDSLVNLELLFAGARAGGRAEWRDLAVRHALMVRRELLRRDGSTTHVVHVDEQTGATVWHGTVQGLHDASTWARGQAWAVYGFTGAWRDSGEPRLLEAARRAADFAISHLPGDGVPRWDYAAPRGAARDTTAGAVLSSGLLELARLDPDPARRAAYRQAGLHTLRTLAGPRYLARGTGSPAILLHGHHSPRYPDAGVTYGDHYLMEALLRVQLLPSRAPTLPARTAVRGEHAVADLGRARKVSAVSVEWSGGARHATRFRITTSTDGERWRVRRGGVSSGRTVTETYDVADRRVRYVRVTVLGAGAVRAVRVRG
jgi:unsaturated chondroitin disaccharide hydrolase